MKINHKTTAEIGGEAPHRPGGIKFYYLLNGEEGSRDNYMLALVEFEDGYFTPQHRHNFEQIRIMIKGAYQWAPDTPQPEGSIAYFCEGSYYTQKGLGHSTQLLLQVAGPSGSGYMSHRQLREHGEKLQEKGSFHNGIYSWFDENGGKHNQDGFEAVWEDVNGKKIEYPKPRYDQPIIFHPARFDYLPVRGASGVWEKNMGKFHERGLLVKQVRIDANSAYEIDGASQSLLFYAISGSGDVNGELWEPGSAFQVELKDVVVIQAKQLAEFYVMGLPVFDA